ncbi:hypothetical protein MKQ68_15140 [Chitinophaga horti]|uniref:Uncharacterized protein n=1 Tax=Chitinophaga horti TaxID=2920382 RepID=A0ABY6IZU6_9BACT|nr:hypothetical protein [Chitinophaga horti]UYQ91427.1 hypothetical protein MKQ68_15140 [Chitinophaga horti]
MKLKPVIILLTLLFPMAIHAQTAESGTQAKSKSQSDREQLIQKLYVEPDGRNAELIAADILKKLTPIQHGPVKKASAISTG